MKNPFSFLRPKHSPVDSAPEQSEGVDKIKSLEFTIETLPGHGVCVRIPQMVFDNIQPAFAQHDKNELTNYVCTHAFNRPYTAVWGDSSDGYLLEIGGAPEDAEESAKAIGKEFTRLMQNTDPNVEILVNKK